MTHSWAGHRATEGDLTRRGIPNNRLPELIDKDMDAAPSEHQVPFGTLIRAPAIRCSARNQMVKGRITGCRRKYRRIDTPRHEGWILKEALKVNIQPRARQKSDPRTYNDIDFQGACGDTGSQGTLIGLRQAKAYCRLVGQKLKLSRSKIRFHFGDGCRNSLGRMELRLPTPNGGYIPIHTDVVDSDIPLLLGLEFLRQELLLLNCLTNELKSYAFKWNVPLIEKFDHIFVEWRRTSHNLCTKAEQQRLHLHFYRPSVGKLFYLLEGARSEDTNSNVYKMLEDITRACDSCQNHSVKPFRFQSALPPENVIFNQAIAIDILWRPGHPVLHVLDTHTHFQNAVAPKSKSTRDIWDVFIECWASLYIEYPSKMRVDQESSIMSKGRESMASAHGIEFQASVVEAHNSIGVGERYHHPLRRIFKFLRDGHPKLDSDVVLRYAIKGINDIMGPEGLVLSLLVVGVIPTFPTVHAELSAQRERLAALDAARKEMETIAAELRMQQALRAQLPPATRYLIARGIKVLIYREKSKQYEGPYTVTKIIEKEV